MTDNSQNASVKIISTEEVAKHNKHDDCWIILGEKGSEKVYDVTTYMDDHPGGSEKFLSVAGRNATAEFWVSKSV